MTESSIRIGIPASFLATGPIKSKAAHLVTRDATCRAGERPSVGQFGRGALEGVEPAARGFLCVPHSGTAPWSTRLRIRGLMPRALTTSTLRPRSS